MDRYTETVIELTPSEAEIHNNRKRRACPGCGHGTLWVVRQEIFEKTLDREVECECGSEHPFAFRRETSLIGRILSWGWLNDDGTFQFLVTQVWIDDAEPEDCDICCWECYEDGDRYEELEILDFEDIRLDLLETVGYWPLSDEEPYYIRCESCPMDFVRVDLAEDDDGNTRVKEFGGPVRTQLAVETC